MCLPAYEPTTLPLSYIANNMSSDGKFRSYGLWVSKGQQEPASPRGFEPGWRRHIKKKGSPI